MGEEPQSQPIAVMLSMSIYGVADGCESVICLSEISAFPPTFNFQSFICSWINSLHCNPLLLFIQLFLYPIAWKKDAISNETFKCILINVILQWAKVRSYVLGKIDALLIKCIKMADSHSMKSLGRKSMARFLSAWDWKQSDGEIKSRPPLTCYVFTMILIKWEKYQPWQEQTPSLDKVLQGPATLARRRELWVNLQRWTGRAAGYASIPHT